MTQYNVRADSFEGPLDLLLSLIEKRKFFINDISLAGVADDYLQYTQDFAEFPMRDVADFLPTAATLVLIKSRSLLPAMQLSDEETSGIKNLEARLRLYAYIRERSKTVRIMMRGPKLWQRPIAYSSKQRRDRANTFVPGKSINMEMLHSVVLRVLARLPETEEPRGEVSVARKITLEETIEHMAKKIENRLALTFSEIHSDAKEKYEIVVSFLALLELIKRGSITARQQNNFLNIEVEGDGVGTPMYV